MKKHKVLIPAILVFVVAAIIAALAARRYSAPRNPREITLDLGGGVTLQLVLVQAGRFNMGSPDREIGHDPSESPVHLVEFSKPFYLGKYEVTQAQWQVIMNSTQAAFPGDGKRPAENMAWSDARKFCKYASEKTGRTLRLPSEAQWEYACRAGSSGPWNTSPGLAEAVYKPLSGPKPLQPAPVGTKLPNSWGLYDMHGNVFEWCEDYFLPNYAKVPADGSAVTTQPKVGEGEEPSRVYRGGSWRNNAEECRSAVRFAASEETRSDTMGFRVAMDAR